MQWSNTPRSRASHSQRGKAVGILADALTDGRLTEDEYQERQAQALNATYIDELEDLLLDLGEASRGSLVPVGDNSLVHDSFVADGEAEPATTNLPDRYSRPNDIVTRFSVGIMGGTTYSGRWAVAKKHFSLGIMGGGTIDLREAVFTEPVTHITCLALMGGVSVIVPPDLNIKVEGIGIMGGFGWAKSDVRAQTPDDDTPTVVINGLAIMGGVSIIRRNIGDPVYED